MQNDGWPIGNIEESICSVRHRRRSKLSAKIKLMRSRLAFLLEVAILKQEEDGTEGWQDRLDPPLAMSESSSDVLRCVTC